MTAKSRVKARRSTVTVRWALQNLDAAFVMLDRTIQEAGLRNKVVFVGDVRVHTSVERREHLLRALGHAEPVDDDVPWWRREWAAECDYDL